MTIYLVRHAQAGTRHDWSGDDLTRPLTREGRRQAADLVDMLGEVQLDQILTSPFLRCIETVAPLAARRSGDGLCIKVHASLAEGPALDAIALVRSFGSEEINAVLCSHGDIIPGVLDALVREDGLDLGPAAKCQKGSTWMIDTTKGSDRFSNALYLPPPR